MIGFLCLLAGSLFAGFKQWTNSEKVKKVQASSIVTNGDFRLTANNKWKDSSKISYADLKWDEISNLTQTGYRLSQSEDQGGTWTKKSLNYGKSIKVLNVYPNREDSNTLQGWMNGLNLVDDQGANLIQVTPVKLSEYNAKPDDYLKDASGDYKYDVIMFGSWDTYGGATNDLNETSYNATKAFSDSGRGVLFGHDTIMHGSNDDNVVQFNKEWFNKYGPLVGTNAETTPTYRYHDKKGWAANDSVTIVNNGYLMKYPFELANDLSFDIPLAHSINHFNLESSAVLWLQFNPDIPSKWDPYWTENNWTNNWYLITNNNVGMIQTGHSNGESKEDERKIIANVLYNLAQVSLENHGDDYTIKDDQSPDEPLIDIRCGDKDHLNIRVDANDKGKIYQWYVEADTKDQGLLKSDTVQEEISSNIAGYFYRVTNTPTSPDFKAEVEAKKDANGRIPEADFDLYVAPNDDTVSYSTATSFSINEKQDSEKYVQVIAVDRMSNVSETTTVQIKDIIQNVDFEIERTGNEAKLVNVALDASINNKMKSIEIQIPKNTEIKDFASLSLPTDWYSFENSETTDYYSFSFAMESNNGAATIQTFLEGLRFTIKNSVNTSGNIKVILHEKVYTSWIDENGTTHYYVFMQEKSAPGKNWFEAYNGAKELRYKGLTGYLATITSEEEHDFIFDNIAKEAGLLGGTRGVLKNGNKINDESVVPQAQSDYDTEQDEWYWASGPEAGESFYVGKTTTGYTPINVYNKFATGEPNNGGGGPSEYILQFAFHDSKEWNDLPGNVTYSADANQGYYVEFSEYGGQTEGDEITDVCWKAAIPQKISLKAYDELGTPVTDGDLIFDQQLRLNQTITVQPTSLEFYSFVELRELDDTSRGMNYTVSGTYQEGQAIYSLRKAILHVRQVVMKPSNELVVPAEGYIEIENRLFNSGSPAIDPTYQANTIVNSGKNADNPAFTNFILTTKPLTDDSDQLVLQPVIPSFYEYLGHYVTTEAASHQNNTSITAGPVMLNRGTIDATNELWLTLYLQPNQTADVENKAPQPYSWDYKKNDLGKIKTK